MCTILGRFCKFDLFFFLKCKIRVFGNVLDLKEKRSVINKVKKKTMLRSLLKIC